MFIADDESVLVSFQSLCEQYPRENVIALWEMAGGQIAAQPRVQPTLLTEPVNYCKPVNGVHAPFCTGHKSQSG